MNNILFMLYLATEHNEVCIIASELKTEVLLLRSKMDCT